MNKQDYRQFAVDLATQAGEILLSHYGAMQKLEWKLRTNFKTQVDDEVDSLIRRRITEAFPEHNIYSEEAAAKENQSEYSWVVDPLDGTLPYTFGVNDHFSVCIALAKGKMPVLGVTNAPKRGELYVAELGKGSRLNGQPIQTGDQADLNQAFIDLEYGKIDRAKHLAYQEKLLVADGAAYTYAHGCASVPLALVASGKLDGYLSLKLEPWDMAAAVVILREAGAKVTAVDGGDWTLEEESILAANPTLHAKLLTLFNGTTKS